MIGSAILAIAHLLEEFLHRRYESRNTRGFPKTSVFGKATLKFAVLQGCYKVKSLKNRKSLSQKGAFR
jgi:hypothetical protein